jgi:hypothetical protein
MSTSENMSRLEKVSLSKKSEHSLSPSLMGLSTKDPDKRAEEQDK